MRIVTFPHPALRYPSVPVRRFDETLKARAREMFDLMYEHKGIGLAANQVGLPLRFFVLNLTGDRDRPEEEQVFVNPEILKRQSTAQDEEGCLSFPGLYAKVLRPKKIRVRAQDLEGQTFEVDADDLFARAVQHESDHLRGKLFIDLLGTLEKWSAKKKIQEVEDLFRASQAQGEYPSDEEIQLQLEEMARTESGSA